MVSKGVACEDRIRSVFGLFKRVQCSVRVFPCSSLYLFGALIASYPCPLPFTSHSLSPPLPPPPLHLCLPLASPPSYFLPLLFISASLPSLLLPPSSSLPPPSPSPLLPPPPSFLPLPLLPPPPLPPPPSSSLPLPSPICNVA